MLLVLPEGLGTDVAPTGEASVEEGWRGGMVLEVGRVEVPASALLDDSCLIVRLADGRRGAEGPGFVRGELPA